MREKLLHGRVKGLIEQNKIAKNEKNGTGLAVKIEKEKIENDKTDKMEVDDEEDEDEKLPHEMTQEEEDNACWLLQRQARTSLIRCYVKNETDAQLLEAKEIKEINAKNGKVKTHQRKYYFTFCMCPRFFFRF